jgi:hypothetical protein
LPTTRASRSIRRTEGIAFDQADGDFFFDGVISTTNSALYRTGANLHQDAANTSLLPATPAGYNHAGDLSFDPVRRRVLLPLECYYPARGGNANTCGTGVIGVADPVTLRFLYYVELDPAQIKKAMWVEPSPDGRWLWTSSGTHLLVYSAAEVNPRTAVRQRAGALGGIAGRDLGAVLPASGVTGATFYGTRLLLALNRGGYSEMISYATSETHGVTTLLGATPTTEITLVRSRLNNESEGLAVTRTRKLDWPTPPPPGGLG